MQVQVRFETRQRLARGSSLASVETRSRPRVAEASQDSRSSKTSNRFRSRSRKLGSSASLETSAWRGGGAVEMISVLRLQLPMQWFQLVSKNHQISWLFRVDRKHEDASRLSIAIDLLTFTPQNFDISGQQSQFGSFPLPAVSIHQAQVSAAMPVPLNQGPQVMGDTILQVRKSTYLWHY